MQHMEQGPLDIGQALACEQCGFEVVVSAACNCEDGGPTMECCGRPMTAAEIQPAGTAPE